MTTKTNPLAVLSRKRAPFRDAAMRSMYDGCVAAYSAKGDDYMAEGNSAASMFRRGFTGSHAGKWDAASRKTLAYAQFRAGQDCAQDAARAAVAELVEKAKKVERHLTRHNDSSGWRGGEDECLNGLRAALAAFEVTP